MRVKKRNQIKHHRQQRRLPNLGEGGLVRVGPKAGNAAGLLAGPRFQVRHQIGRREIQRGGAKRVAPGLFPLGNAPLAKEKPHAGGECIQRSRAPLRKPEYRRAVKQRRHSGEGEQQLSRKKLMGHPGNPADEHAPAQNAQ
ncbi:hypothetical protein SDC9_192780 [bioreactor metagenome]|uniref:Uncharacterized protein n=1 Tax=bioreactor metagenome TaxID=1076179 RepID=A0A645ICQ4_9ZZZZ